MHDAIYMRQCIRIARRDIIACADRDAFQALLRQHGVDCQADCTVRMSPDETYMIYERTIWRDEAAQRET